MCVCLSSSHAVVHSSVIKTVRRAVIVEQRAVIVTQLMEPVKVGYFKTIHPQSES